MPHRVPMTQRQRAALLALPATEAWLVACCLKKMMPANVARDDPTPMQALSTGSPSGSPATAGVPGLDFPCASKAGKELAEKVFPLLMKCLSLQGRDGLVESTRKEWEVALLPDYDPIGCAGAKE